jgi:hypothetical protein
MGAGLSLLGPALSIGGSLFGMANSPQVPTPPPAYGFQSLPAADTAYTSGVQNLSNTTSPLASSTLDYLYNNPGTAGAVSAGNVAGGLGEAAGLSQFGTGMGLIGAGTGAIPYASAAFNEGFDPLRNIYNQQFQQQTDQTRALEAAQGVAGTPYGAGVEAQADINFNNAWQNNLLQRMTQGAAAGSQILGAGTGTTQQGISDITGAPGTFYAGGTMPYNTAQTIGGNQYGAITGFQGIQQQPLMDWMNYLQQGTAAQNAQTAQYQAMVNAQNNQFNQFQTLGKNLGAGIQGFTGGYGGGALPYGSSVPGAYGPTSVGGAPLNYG